MHVLHLVLGIALALAPAAHGSGIGLPDGETRTGGPFGGASEPARLEPLHGRDGGWYELPPRILDRPHTAIDSRRGRLIVIEPNGAVLTLPLDGEPRWMPLLALGSPPQDQAQGAFYDEARDRILVPMGGTPMSVWELVLSPIPYWHRLETAGEVPIPRTEATYVLDVVNDRLIMFGGLTEVQCGHAYCVEIFTSETWVLKLGGQPTWQRLPVVESTALARADAFGALDARRQRLFITRGRGFGPTQNGEQKSDAWVLDFAGPPTWTRLLPQGAVPPLEINEQAVHDVKNDRLIVFDNEGASLVTRVLSLDDVPTWAALPIQGFVPPARYWPGAVFDVVHDRVVVMGGQPHGLEVLFLELTEEAHWNSWIPLNSVAGLVHRHFGSAIHDPVHRRMLVCSGGRNVLELPLDPIGVWRMLPTIGGEPQFGSWGPNLAYDSRRRRMLAVGGQEVWGLSLAGTPAWTLIAAGGPLRLGGSVTYDAIRDRLIVFGGQVSHTELHSDVWTLSLEGTPRWERLLPDGAGPSARSVHTAIHDPIKDRLVVFGGEGPGFVLTPDELWELALAGPPVWRSLEPAGDRPPTRTAHTAVLDAEEARMLIFSGDIGMPCAENVSFATTCNDVWEFDLRVDRWRKLRPAGPLPRGRLLHAASFDPIGRRMISVGGSANGGAQGHTWVLDLNPLELSVRIDVLPESPRNQLPPRSRGDLRVAVFGSATVPVGSLDLSSLTLSEAGVSALPHGGFIADTKDLDRDGSLDLLVHFDREAIAVEPGVNVLRLEGHLANGIPVHGADRVHVPSGPQPASRAESEKAVAPRVLALMVMRSTVADIEATFDVPAAGPTRLELFDLAGRRIESVDIGPTEARARSFVLATAGALPNGIYFVRLAHRSGTLVRRIAVLHGR